MNKSLPARPQLSQLRKLSRDLLNKIRSGDAHAIELLVEFHPSISDKPQLPSQEISLHHTQLVIARQHGFSSWAKLKNEVELRNLNDVEQFQKFVQSGVLDYGSENASSNDAARMLIKVNPELLNKHLEVALILGDFEKARNSIQKLATRINDPIGPKQWSPLLYVCFSKFLKSNCENDEDISSFHTLVRTLLSIGADPNAFFSMNNDPNARQTCLYGVSGLAGSPDLTELLLDSGADPNDMAPGLGPESLYHASELKNPACAHLILQKKPHPDKVSYCLGRALDFENPEMVKVFLKAGADPNFIHPYGEEKNSRLHGAIKNNRSLEIIKDLLKHGADPNLHNAHSLSPVRLAMRMGRIDILEECQLSVKEYQSFTIIDSIIGSCMMGDEKKARSISLENQDILSQLNTNDSKAVSQAAYSKNLKAVQLMVSLGFPIDVLGTENMSALHWSTWNGDYEMCQFLIENGADPEQLNGYGGSAIGCAAYSYIHNPSSSSNHLKIVSYLLKQGVQVEGSVTYPSGRNELDIILKPYFEKNADQQVHNHVYLMREAEDKLPINVRSTSIKEIVLAWADLFSSEFELYPKWVDMVVRNHMSDLANLRSNQINPTMHQARDCMARYFGFQGFEFCPDEAVSEPFEKALDHMLSGDIESLKEQLIVHPELIHQRSRFGHKAQLLHYVASNGVEIHRQYVPSNIVAITKLLLEFGAEPDALAETYGGGIAQTPLTLLITSGHPEELGIKETLIELLVQFGANPNGRENEGTPLATVIQFGYQKSAETLIKLGATPNSIEIAAGGGLTQDVLKFLDKNPDQKNLNEAIYLASRNGYFSCVQILLDHGADVDSLGFFGASAIHWAAHNGHEKIVKLLVNHNADLNLRDTQFHSLPTGWAHENNHTNIRDFLIQEGCPVNLPEAAAFGRKDLIKNILIEEPERVNEFFGRTALHEAAARGHLEIIKILIHANCDLSIQSDNKMTALQIAQAAGHKDIVQLLETCS